MIIKEWIIDNLWDYPINLVYRAYRKIRKMVIWFPVIWKDEDYDSVYLYEIMIFKISLIRKDMEKSARHVGYEKNVRQMKIVEQLLNRHAFSDYYFVESEKIRDLEKSSGCICPFDTIEWEKKGKFFEMIDKRCSFCSRSMKRWIKAESLKEKNDLEYAFKIMANHSRGWWN